MTTSKKLRFVFASELPEAVSTNTVYFLNNGSNKSIVIIGDIVTSKITFNSVETIEKYLTNGYLAAGDTAEEARAVIEAAAAIHDHDVATQTSSGFMSAQDKIKLDSIVELSAAQVKDPNSEITGLVSGNKLKQAFTEFLEKSSVESPDGTFIGVEFEIGFVYTGLNKPTQGVWVETDQIYLKDSFPVLYNALGSKPLGPPSFTPGNISISTTVNNKSAVFAFDKWWISSGGKIYSSTDGITFTLINEVTGGEFKDLILFKGKLFVPSTNSNFYFITTDGVNWTSSNFNPYVTAFSPKAHVVDGILVITGGSDSFIYTEDLLTWTVNTLPLQVTELVTRVEKVNGVYFIFQSTTNGSGACYSTDLINWSLIPYSVKVDNSPVYFNGFYFVLLASNNDYIRTSDFSSWTQFSTPTGNITNTNVKLYVYKSQLLWLQHGSTLSKTSDGSSWNSLSTSLDVFNYLSLEDNSQFVTEDENYLYVLTANGYGYTPDGINWKSHVSKFYTSDAPTYIGYQGNFLFLRINNKLVVTPDLNNWYEVLASGSSGYPVGFNGKEHLVISTGDVTSKLAITSYDPSTQFYIPPLKYPEAGIYKQWIKAL